MSEFSESLHLRTRSASAAANLLRRAGAVGFVLPPLGGFCAIAVKRGSLDRVVAANRGTLLAYDYAGDHGCSIAAYVGTERVARLSMSFETPRRRFDRSAFVTRKLLTERAASELQKTLDGDGVPGAAELARPFGITRFRWFSYDYERSATFPAEGRVHVGEESPAPTDHVDEEMKALMATISAPRMAEASTARNDATPMSVEVREGLEALADLQRILDDR